jgi:hypothetical protein
MSGLATGDETLSVIISGEIRMRICIKNHKLPAYSPNPLCRFSASAHSHQPFAQQIVQVNKTGKLPRLRHH